MKSRSLHNSIKKGLFYRDVTAFHEVPLIPLPSFPSCKMNKNAMIYPQP